jgi:glyoxylase-like metal-dependent hydrolase (beta-lactamase superfamily II)
MPLPGPSEHQNYCIVSALEGGEFTMPLDQVVMGVNDRVSVPSLAFLIRHSSSEQTIVFDLGLRRDIEQYPPAVVAELKDTDTGFAPVNVLQTVAESLLKGGLDPAMVDYVIYSHLHFGE